MNSSMNQNNPETYQPICVILYDDYPRPRVLCIL